MKNKDKNTSESKKSVSLLTYAKTNKVAYIIFIILNIATVFTIVSCVLDGRAEGVFNGILAQLLLLIPLIVKKNFRVELPTLLESVAYFFVFCAQILGEINSFYTKYPLWDTMLHTICGFIFAAFGFCLFDILNKNRKSKFELSPFFLTLLAFCFSITIGTLWEFFEFAMDMMTVGDMQKDCIINEFGSVLLHPDGVTKTVRVLGIEKTVIYTATGEIVIEGGYLDIGLIDTLKDMFVNFVGALVFSIFGYVYIKTRGKGKVAKQFIPVLKGSADNAESEFETFADTFSIEPVTDNLAKNSENKGTDFENLTK